MEQEPGDLQQEKGQTDQPEPPGKVVLVCPLDWGIGHATRCVPVIRALQDSGFSVVIGASGRSMEFLKHDLPELRFIEFPGAEITYPANNRLVLRLIGMLPQLLFQVYREHRSLKRLVNTTGACMVVSDNRYGCWSSEVPSVFITHQIAPQLPHSLRWLKAIPRRVSRFFINRFTECWIPDFEAGNGLAGKLSHPDRLPGRTRYIGLLSRFDRLAMQYRPQVPPGIDLLVMLSGPEPQRTLFENIILRQTENSPLTTVVVRGLPGLMDNYEVKGRVHLFGHLDTEKLFELMERSVLVVCRSGYSSIMDLMITGKRAILVPTPGQTEQEYLAKYLMEKKIYFSVPQDQFDLVYAMELSKNFPGMVIRSDDSDLKARIRAISSSHPC